MKVKYVFIHNLYFCKKSISLSLGLVDGSQLKYKWIGGIIQENVPMVSEATILPFEN